MSDRFYREKGMKDKEFGKSPEYQLVTKLNKTIKTQAKEIEALKDILRDLYFTEPGELPKAVIKVCDEVGI